MKRLIFLVIPLLFAAGFAFGASPVYTARYNEGYSLFSKGRFTQSIRHFRLMLADDRTNDLSDNCQYWIGEAYFNLKQYEQALLEFDRVLTFPGTNKREDALYKIGDCHEKLGNPVKAREIYLRLLADYPSSRHASYILKYLQTTPER